MSRWWAAPKPLPFMSAQYELEQQALLIYKYQVAGVSRDLVVPIRHGLNSLASRLYGHPTRAPNLLLPPLDAMLVYFSVVLVLSCCNTDVEILTEAALLKMQELEIEELSKQPQGSQSEGLEQVVLKLRNDMHNSKLERDRLAMEVEERKLRETLKAPCG